jgi:hypothetical protein
MSKTAEPFSLFDWIFPISPSDVVSITIVLMRAGLLTVFYYIVGATGLPPSVDISTDRVTSFTDSQRTSAPLLSDGR